MARKSPLLKATLIALAFGWAGIAMAADAPPDQGVARPDAASRATAPVAAPELSPQAAQVARIAERDGDKEFLMVDKARGEIILFRDGAPVFSGPALTGAAMGDRVPPNVLRFTGTHPLTTEQKVTPAGRFTVRPEYDPDYGRVWTITEIHGKDWDFAIHQVYLGIPSEHRDARIHSPDAGDRHITFGCINVERAAIAYFTRTLPRKIKVPLYILPEDQNLTAVFFPPRR